MRKKYILVLFAAFFLSLSSTSCSSDASPSESMGTTTGNYWPLEIGNKWNFQDDATNSNLMEIIGTEVFGGVTYYKMSNFNQEYQLNMDSWVTKKGATYYQKSGEVTTIQSGVTVTMGAYEVISFKDDLNVDETWTGSYNQDITTVYNGQTQKSKMNTTYVGKILERDAVVTLNGKDYTNVIKVSVIQKGNFNGTMIEVSSEDWYAKDIGPIRSVVTSNGTVNTSVLKDCVLK